VGRALAAAALAATLAVGVSVAQGRGEGRHAKALPGLPAYTAGYTSWFKINRRPLPRRTSDPHDGTKNVYASKRLRAGRYPFGTVIVKEAFRAGERVPYLVAVMRKVRGASPRNNDWIMIEWTRSSARDRFAEVARGQVCYGCHVGAKKTDYVFTRG
jgi:hypothetical protein